MNLYLIYDKKLNKGSLYKNRTLFRKALQNLGKDFHVELAKFDNHSDLTVFLKHNKYNEEISYIQNKGANNDRA